MPRPPCTGPDCERESRIRGLCDTHYQQQRAGRELRPIRPYHETDRPIAW